MTSARMPAPPRMVSQQTPFAACVPTLSRLGVMKQSLLMVTLTMLVLPLALHAQQPELVYPGPRLTSDWRLFSHVSIVRPTLVILLPLTLSDTGTARMRLQLGAADSLMKSLESVAKQYGFVFEVRAAAWASIHDRRANAHYAASQVEPGPALVIATPGFRPRLLQYWPNADQLSQEIEDHATVFRPLIPM